MGDAGAHFGKPVFFSQHHGEHRHGVSGEFIRQDGDECAGLHQRKCHDVDDARDPDPAQQ